MWAFEECLGIVTHGVRNDIHSLQKLLDVSEVTIVDRVRGDLSRILDKVSTANPEDHYFVEIFNEKLKTRCMLVSEGKKLLRIACGGLKSNTSFNPEEFCRSIDDSEITLIKVVPPLFQWGNEMIYGFEPLDAQHERILHKWNELIKELIKGVGREIMIVENLINDVLEHLKFEEDLMRKYKYPRAKQHFKDHEDFRNLLKHILEKAREIGVLDALKENIGFVYAYLAHLNSIDRELASFLRKNVF
ncbi:MAG: bacteriohemerythrin [Thermosphaera sp.]